MCVLIVCAGSKLRFKYMGALEHKIMWDPDIVTNCGHPKQIFEPHFEIFSCNYENLYKP